MQGGEYSLRPNDGMFARVPGAMPQAKVNVTFGQNFGMQMRNVKDPTRPPGPLPIDASQRLPVGTSRVPATTDKTR